MAPDPVREYVAAHQALRDATERVTHFVKSVQQAAHLLGDWRHVIIGGFAVPEHLIGAPAIDRLPTLAEVGVAISAWHAARLRAENAWLKVPAEKRSSLQPPDQV